MGIRIWVICYKKKKKCFVKLWWEVPQLPSLRYQRFQFQVLIQTNNSAKDDCEIGFVDGDGDHCSMLIGNNRNYRKRLWNQPLKHSAWESNTDALIGWISTYSYLSWRARYKLIDNAAECRQMGKIYTI